MKKREKRVIFEKGNGFISGAKGLKQSLNSKAITAGIVAAIFGCTGPALVVMNAASKAGFSFQETASWLFGVYVFGGAVSIFMACQYKMPIIGAYSILGASMLDVALVGYSFSEAIGAFIIAGCIIVLVGITGLMGKIMKWLPLPIVMGMIGGCMLRFGTNIVVSTIELPIVCLSALVGFLLVPKFLKKIPPVIGALVFGVVATLITQDLNVSTQSIAYAAPMLTLPNFNVSAILSISIPLAAIVMGAEMAQAIGVLYAQDYKPPVNAMLIVTGTASIAASFFGAHNVNIAGPMTAICSSEEAGEEKDHRYSGAVINGALMMLFGVFSSYAISFINIIPSQLINVLAGLAMINVLINSFQVGFGSGKYKMGAFVALVIGASGMSLLGIGSALWALIGGIIVSLICDTADFKKPASAKA